MNSKKKFVISTIVVCLLLLAVVSVYAVVIDKHEHRHKYGNRIFYISSQGITCGESCDCGTEKTSVTEYTIENIWNNVTENDTIMLTENIALENNLVINPNGQNGAPVKMNVNLDLGGFNITSTQSNAETLKALIEIKSNQYSKVNFNIKNGSLNAGNLLYAIKFTNTSFQGEKNINLTLNDVDLFANGSFEYMKDHYDYAAVLFAGDDSEAVSVTATDCSFEGAKTYVNANNSANMSVGVFINSKYSEFNFTNCNIKGGDAVYVKDGKVNLTGCALEASAPVGPIVLTNTFRATGRCLAINSYTSGTEDNYTTTKFEITVKDCTMDVEGDGGCITIGTSAAQDLSQKINDDSYLNIVSCKAYPKLSSDFSHLYLPEYITISTYQGSDGKYMVFG